MMNLIVQFSFAFSIVVLQIAVANGQVGVRNNASAFSLPDAEVPSGTITKVHFTGLREDRQTHYKLAIPFMSLPMNTSSFSGDPYWMGSVTTQSYNRGKQAELKQARLRLFQWWEYNYRKPAQKRSPHRRVAIWRLALYKWHKYRRV